LIARTHRFTRTPVGEAISTIPATGA
jgi:hypothetical protein